MESSSDFPSSSGISPGKPGDNPNLDLIFLISSSRSNFDGSSNLTEPPSPSLSSICVIIVPSTWTTFISVILPTLTISPGVSSTKTAFLGRYGPFLICSSIYYMIFTIFTN